MRQAPRENAADRAEGVAVPRDAWLGHEAEEERGAVAAEHDEARGQCRAQRL